VPVGDCGDVLEQGDGQQLRPGTAPGGAGDVVEQAVVGHADHCARRACRVEVGRSDLCTTGRRRLGAVADRAAYPCAQRLGAVDPELPAAYELVRLGAWPTPVLRLGRLIKVLSAPLAELLGLSEDRVGSGSANR